MENRTIVKENKVIDTISNMGIYDAVRYFGGYDKLRQMMGDYELSKEEKIVFVKEIVEKLCEEYDNLELKVHSSYNIYAMKERQENYEKTPLHQRLEKHPNIKNIGFVSNDELKKSLASSHIFPYPSTYRETFCLALLEAMSAGLLCVHPNYACLPETASNWTMMYDYHENKEVHEEIFINILKKQ